MAGLFRCWGQLRHHTNHMVHFNLDLMRARRAIAGRRPVTGLLALLVLGAGCGALHAQQATPAPQAPPASPAPPAPQAPQAQSALTRDGLTPPDPAVSAPLSHYLQWRSASFVDWLWDGSMLIATRFGDTEQIHRLRVPLGMREQLSYAPGGVAAAAARPYASDAFVYLEPHHGGDSGQLMLQRLADQSLTALTDGAHRDGPALWAHDGKRIAFASNRRNSSDVDIYVLDTGQPGATPRLVVGGAGNHWRAYDWSLDDKRLLLGRELPGDGASVNSSAGAMPESELYIAGVDSGEITTVGEDSAGAAAGA